MSNYAAINGVRIVSGSLTFPLTGLWYADLTLATPAPLSGPLVITLGNLTCAGVALRDAPFAGSRSARIVAGSGGWRKTIPERSYQNDGGVRLSMVVRDAASEAGEQVNVVSDRVLGNAFTRLRDAASATLWLVSGDWWTTPAGVATFGPRDKTPIPSRFDVLKFGGALARTTVATEDPAAWTPGRTFNAPVLGGAQTISTVVHTLDEDGHLRTEVLAS